MTFFSCTLPVSGTQLSALALPSKFSTSLLMQNPTHPYQLKTSRTSTPETVPGPPLDCSQEELFKYIKTMKAGDRVKDFGRWGIRGWIGTIVISDHGQVNIRWDDHPCFRGVITHFTEGSRRLPPCRASFEDRPAHKGYPTAEKERDWPKWMHTSRPISGPYPIFLRRVSGI